MVAVWRLDWKDSDLEPNRHKDSFIGKGNTIDGLGMFLLGFRTAKTGKK